MRISGLGSLRPFLEKESGCGSPGVGIASKVSRARRTAQQYYFEREQGCGVPGAGSEKHTYTAGSSTSAMAIELNDLMDLNAASKFS